MPVSSEEKEFVAYLLELMQPMGPITARSMFGGHGIFLESRMFALVAEGVLYLKTNDSTALNFQDKGLEAFTYEKNGKPYKMSYYQAPEDALEDSELMVEWARQAYQVAMSAATKKSKALISL